MTAMNARTIRIASRSEARASLHEPEHSSFVQPRRGPGASHVPLQRSRDETRPHDPAFIVRRSRVRRGRSFLPLRHSLRRLVFDIAGQETAIILLYTEDGSDRITLNR